MERILRKHSVGLPGALHNPSTVTHVKIPFQEEKKKKNSPEAKFQARYNPQSLFGRQSTRNHEFVDHFILEDLSEIACKKNNPKTWGEDPRLFLKREGGMGSNLYWFHMSKFLKIIYNLKVSRPAYWAWWYISIYS